ncbi:MAG: hypothetical protein Q8L74_00445 [Nitrospirota bacterium]|nr:hypothetical protein [Nitrospirota bacterium]
MLNPELDVVPIKGQCVSTVSAIAAEPKAMPGTAQLVSTGTAFSAAEAQVLIDFSSRC